MSTKRYTGHITTVRREEKFGFIGIGSVIAEDGSDHDIPTTADIFVHQDECAIPLEVGAVVRFEIIADQRRGDGHFRAIGVTKDTEAEVVPESDPIIQHFSAFALVPAGQGSAGNATTALAHPIPPHPWASRAKKVPEETVAQTIENGPLPHASREEGIISASDPRVAAALSAFLQFEFPHMAGLGLGYDVIGVDEATFDGKVAEGVADLNGLGMVEQAAHVEREVARFRGTRKALAYMIERGLLRRNTFISVRYLPDLFMAVPVWYFAVGGAGKQQADAVWKEQDPSNHPATIAICDLFPKNLRWADTFQMFNRRLRPLSRYKGDVIPVPIVRLIKEAREYFDHIVIATPYHDVAGQDWGNLEWLRSIDPYVLGFQQGCSHFFVLGRFSDSGVFPLYHELVADTVEFLRVKMEQLREFNQAHQPYWYVGRNPGDCHGRRYDAENPVSMPLGDHLVQHTKQLLAAFEAGHLFDWLREEWSPPADQAADQTQPATTPAIE